MNRRAEQAPPVRRMRSQDEMISELEAKLQSDFSLPLLPEFTILVEGWTDVSYLEAAARVAKGAIGEDLLEIPAGIAGDNADFIHIRTPGSSLGPERGGVRQMVRLAETLKPYVFTLELFKGLVFLFDHDTAGLEAAAEVNKKGYKGRALTIDPKFHPGACAQNQVVIEDLLSLQVQKKFFDAGNAWCTARYEDGEIVRFDWDHESKDKLRDHVCSQGSWDDLREIARVLVRIRKAIGLPYSNESF